MVPEQACISVTLRDDRGSYGRSVCDGQEQPSSCVLLQVSDSGIQQGECAYHELGSDVGLCQSTLRAELKGFAENQKAPFMPSASDSPVLAQPNLVSDNVQASD